MLWNGNRTRMPYLHDLYGATQPGEQRVLQSLDYACSNTCLACLIFRGGKALERRRVSSLRGSSGWETNNFACRTAHSQPNSSYPHLPSQYFLPFPPTLPPFISFRPPLCPIPVTHACKHAHTYTGECMHLHLHLHLHARKHTYTRRHTCAHPPSRAPSHLPVVHGRCEEDVQDVAVGRCKRGIQHLPGQQQGNMVNAVKFTQ